MTRPLPWASKAGVFPWHASDTNRHGYARSRYGYDEATVARSKSGTSYKRPGHDLCREGHVPIVWGYEGQDGYSMHASPPAAIVKSALSELEQRGGSKPTQVEVTVQMIWLKPGEWTSQRSFMSWGLV